MGKLKMSTFEKLVYTASAALALTTAKIMSDRGNEYFVPRQGRIQYTTDNPASDTATVALVFGAAGLIATGNRREYNSYQPSNPC